MSVIYIRNKDGTLTPISSSNNVKTVNGVEPDENGNIEIAIPDSGGNVAQGLTAAQIAALDGMFKIASFTADPTDAYIAFKKAFGIADDPAGELLEFDLIEGNITVGSTYVKYWANIDGSQTKRMEMNPALVRHNSDYQYTAKLTPNADYYMHPHWLSFDNTADTFEVDGTENVVWAGNATAIGEQAFNGGGKFTIPECDVFFVHLGRVNKAELTDADKEWLRNNFTVEMVKVGSGDSPVEPEEPTVETLEFDLVNGNITVKDTFIRFWSNHDGSQPSRMEMNPALIRYDSGYQYTAKLSSGDYYMHPQWVSFDNTTATFEVDETVAMTTWNGTAALIGEQSFYGGGELIIPECDAFFVHLGRKDKANLTDEDKNWLRNNFTVERVKV